ncbi:methyl-accepting chemotaxis protein [Aquincola tertiaricarbonis]|uniref:Methyl-accepting chemotaxis protein n=1 Tax=Aquincola tertiaricarbonis TaxID=391953 RepID=A0ABY4S5P4_AQUTE|nr:methyl-accepting chemotaxis protein [Aquincola tertiaricarbonis]URI08314.1 methyl-accepting chemotaxis protein [Aquincola tertiaricarbonis]
MPVADARGADGFFAHHGPWAPGVRLFRRLRFSGKAVLVSVAFLVPLVLLMVSYLQGVGESLSFTRKELAGVQMLRKIEPWLIEVQKQRRRVLSGEMPRPDMAAIEQLMRPVQALVQARPEGVDAAATVAQALQAHQALAQAADAPGQVAQRLQAYVDALRSMRSSVLDVSGLSLDPEQATYYLMTASALTAPELIEGISRSRGLSGALAREGATPAGVRDLYAAWYTAAKAVDGLTDDLRRAAQAEPEVATRLDVEAAVKPARAFLDAAAKPWFGEAFQADVQALNPTGQAAVDALRKLSAEGTVMLEELLRDREARVLLNRNLTLAFTAGSLLLGMYLFYAFYLVMNGGLGEVRRHLKAMTAGDLTTMPRPWGRDEAASLMLTLAEMQASLRGIVGEVRHASDAIVNASSEIADASHDLSVRSEQAAANLQESAAAMDEISATVQNTAVSVKRAADMAVGNAETAGAGGRTIEEVIRTMGGVQSSSQRIGDIIGTIDGIAFQTNILALNAAVEAARAGEQGRGFAVVAGEVRTLAQRSAEAAREIKGLISASVQRVDEGSSVVGQAGVRMSELVDTASRMRELMTEVLTGTGQQSTGVAEVGAALQQLDQQTQQNAALVEETAAAASTLRQQAQGLAERVARFKLPV